MNSVILIGRLTRDPEIRYTPAQLAVATFTLAVDRQVKQGEEKQADFLRITAFGKTAELVERFLVKGRLVAVQGRIQTGSYKNKEGATVYTTDVVADRVQFLEWGEKSGGADYAAGPRTLSENSMPSDIPEGFQTIDDEDIPF